MMASHYKAIIVHRLGACIDLGRQKLVARWLGE
jgi:hypothetical protein